MTRIAMLLSVLLTSVVLVAGQTASPAPAPLERQAPPPQSPREALLEMFFGTAPDHLDRHLPEIARQAFLRLEKTGGRSFLDEVSAIGMHAKADSGGLQTLATGPILLTAEEPGGDEKFEVTVEHDNLMGDDDEIELSFHMYRKRKLEALPVIPNLTFMMKMEDGIWRLNEARFTARMPLGDPDFLKTLVKQIEEKQRDGNQMRAQFSIRALQNAEKAYHAKHPQFSCSLKDLTAAGGGDEQDPMPVDEELASGKKNSYIFALTGCDASHYKIAAEPAAAGTSQYAFCTDESEVIKFSKDGEAINCLMHGETGPESGEGGNTVFQNVR
jgi:hypothetical protein